MKSQSNRSSPEPNYRISIPQVRPEITCGKHPVKRIVGERLVVAADVIKDGHDTFVAEIRYRRVGESECKTAPMTYSYDDDEWSGEILLPQIGEFEYTAAVWTDVFASWADEVRRKVDAGRDVASELLEGIALIRETAAASSGEPAGVLENYAALIHSASPQSEQVYIALSPTLRELMSNHQARGDETVYSRWLGVTVDRERARFSAWYEFFPRSTIAPATG
ncbi:MAG: maltotransferase domain-containing protein, partial [Chloroflexia bacterium]